MKKFFLIALIAFIGLAHTAHATGYTYEPTGGDYRINIQTTDIGAFITITVKTSGSIDADFQLLNQPFDGNLNNAGQAVAHQDTVTLQKGINMFWIGGLHGGSTYYFYPFFYASPGKTGPKVNFTTDSIVSGGSYSNGAYTFTYKILSTEKSDLFVTAIPRSALTITSFSAINTANFPYTKIGKAPASGQGAGTVTGLTAGTEYVLVMQPGGVGATEPLTAMHILTSNPAASVSAAAKTLVFTGSGSTESVTGQIDGTKVPFPEDYAVSLEYSPTSTTTIYSADPKDPSLLNKSNVLYFAHTALDYSKGGEGINHIGSYYWTLNNIGTGDYWFRETFWTSDKKTVIGTPVVAKFNGDKGILLSGSAADQDNFEQHSYRLLAPLPGLSVLLDPELCQEQQNQGIQSGQICNINDFLNYALRILVGVAAVILVLRIMIEGFKYATSDVLTIKISSREKLWQGVWGLLLALSAWLILNTINPKLVQNDIELPTITLTLTPGNDGLGIAVPAGQAATGQKLYLKNASGTAIPVTACDATTMSTVTAFGTTFQIQKDLVPSIQRIDAKWRQLNPAYKIPMTVKDSSEIGGYVCRNIAGKNTLSYHAFGLAVDINPVENPQGKTLVTDMPSAFVQLWKNEGWGWGGDWSSSKDAMHFSKGINEGGTMIAN